MRTLQYRRALLKLSGEVLAGEHGGGIDFAVAEAICEQIKHCVSSGVQMSVVIGGGNFWRGRTSGKMDAVRADQMGMLATLMNAVALADTLEQIGQKTLVQSAFVVPQVAGCINKAEALRALENGRVVIFGGGTGNPFFTTDSAAVLRASEIEADIVLKATNVDGVFDKDPKKHADAVKYDTLTYDEILRQHLKVMDATAAALARERHLPMFVFNLTPPENIGAVFGGGAVGTCLTRE
ncbi:MAG: UMP kinase [Oscillospiraceae bacterium]|nr:UMP kinase [Oscillospiraceae bacterium]